MNKIEKALLEGKLIQRTCNYLRQALKRLSLKLSRNADEALGIAYRKFFSIKSKIVENKIVFMTYQNQYTCNPKYITEKLIENKVSLDLVWVVDKATLLNPQKYGIPSEVRLVQRNSCQSFSELMTAKVWVDNALNCPWKFLSKKRRQIYLNTWHGSLGIKRLDTYDPNKGYWRRIARRSNHMINYMLSNSEFEDNVFHTAYWPDVKTIHTGHARNDMFFDEKVLFDLREKVLGFYSLDSTVKLALYAPTFRDNKNVACFDIDYQLLHESLTERFDGDWKILMRLHFHNKKVKKKKTSTDYVIDATQYPDIQELMAAADVGITDYSSWIYDFMLTRRSCFIYASDMSQYNHQRGFYYPLEETPFPLATTNEELQYNIVQFNEELYCNKVEKFLEEKGCMEDGHACERIEALILNCLDGMMQ